MRKYNSGELTITIPLAEFQSLTLAARVVERALDDSDPFRDMYDDIVEQLAKEDNET